MKSIKQIALENLARKSMKMDSDFCRCPTKKNRKALEKIQAQFWVAHDKVRKQMKKRICI